MNVGIANCQPIVERIVLAAGLAVSDSLVCLFTRCPLDDTSHNIFENMLEGDPGAQDYLNAVAKCVQEFLEGRSCACNIILSEGCDSDYRQSSCSVVDIGPYLAQLILGERDVPSVCISVASS